MSLDKSINSGKERRKKFGKETGTYAKSVDKTCRNHGNDYYSLGNRLYKNKKREKIMEEKLEEFKGRK